MDGILDPSYRLLACQKCEQVNKSIDAGRVSITEGPHLDYLSLNEFDSGILLQNTGVRSRVVFVHRESMVRYVLYLSSQLIRPRTSEPPFEAIWSITPLTIPHIDDAQPVC